jgi:hypothetical protein
MRFIVRIPELDCSLYEKGGDKNLPELFHLIQKLEKSGKLLEGGLLADDMGGFLLMEAGSFAEQEALLNSVFDPSRYQVESHPILPFKELAVLMNKMEKREMPAFKAPAGREPKSRKIGQHALAID